MSYTDAKFTKRVLQDDFLSYPSELNPYFDFAESIINGRLAGQYEVPFADGSIPVLIRWIASYLVGYKLYDRAAALQELSDSNMGQKWWEMAQNLLTGIVEGEYLLHLEDGTLVEIAGSTSGPRAYPSGVREKAPSTENVPFFKRAQAGNW